MSTSPKVSILIPTYNYARYLPEAIESVLAQDFTDYELIIADDCSPDDSAAVLARYTQRDPRIRIHLHRPNLGMVANWNWCLREARGEYIKFLFGDDCFASPDALTKLVRLLDSHPTASLAASARLTITDDSRVDGIWDELKRDGLYPGHALIEQCLRSSCNLIGEPSVVLFRRSLGTRGFAPSFKQIVDLEMWFHLILTADLAYTAEPLCCFRRHGTQQTAVNLQSQAGHTEMIRMLREYAPALDASTPPTLSRTIAKKRTLFRTWFLLSKKQSSQPDLLAELAWLRGELSLPWLCACWLLYRLSRPFDNLRHSLRKRSLRKNIALYASGQLAFIASLRPKATHPHG